VISIVCAFIWYKLKDARRDIPDDVVERQPATKVETPSGNLNNRGIYGKKRESGGLIIHD
jgi:hypothetical protein